LASTLGENAHLNVLDTCHVVQFSASAPAVVFFSCGLQCKFRARLWPCNAGGRSAPCETLPATGMSNDSVTLPSGTTDVPLLMLLRFRPLQTPKVTASAPVAFEGLRTSASNFTENPVSTCTPFGDATVTVGPEFEKTKRKIKLITTRPNSARGIQCEGVALEGDARSCSSGCSARLPRRCSHDCSGTVWKKSSRVSASIQP